MTTIAQIPATAQDTTANHLLTLAICAAYRQAKAQHLETPRMVKGAQLALDGHVTLLANGTATVRSQAHDRHYHVNGACDCPDVPQAPYRACKHKWAVWFLRRAHQMLMAAAVAALDGEEGARCPECGQATVIQVGLWGKTRMTYTPYRVCRMVLAVGGERYACGWQERAAAYQEAAELLGVAPEEIGWEE